MSATAVVPEVFCIEPSCRHQLDPAWAFCPYCGQDNRPPESRLAVGSCGHDFIKGADYCVDCGELWGSTRGLRLANTWLYLAAGVAMVVGAGVALASAKSSRAPDDTAEMSLYLFLGGVMALVMSLASYMRLLGGRPKRRDWVEPWQQTYPGPNFGPNIGPDELEP